MTDQHAVDITELATLGELFPLRLMQLGFQLFQVMDEAGHDQYHYVVPPVCVVPEGIFTMGSDTQRDPDAVYDELPQHEVDVPSFQIGAYPLTVAEYACAVEAGAVEAPQNTWPPTWQTQQRTPDHPVVCITWEQARAYCAWLAQVTILPWRLPTEAEWEKAARGTDGRIYPWGDQWDQAKANTDDGEPQTTTTTPVGTYAVNGDASPYGAHDMTGNVEERTSSIYQQEYPYRSDQSENDAITHAQRVLRGGSWGSRPQDARAATRNRRLGNRYADIGCRLAMGARRPANLCAVLRRADDLP